MPVSIRITRSATQDCRAIPKTYEKKDLPRVHGMPYETVRTLLYHYVIGSDPRDWSEVAAQDGEGPEGEDITDNHQSQPWEIEPIREDADPGISDPHEDPK